jgi:uncharacterized Zn-binding protein involved in type VI secretion
MAASNICRLGDLAASPNIESSRNVFVNLIGVHRLGEAWSSHGRGRHKSAVTSSASKTVFVNLINVARVGDDTSCGHTISTGSPNTFAG